MGGRNCATIGDDARINIYWRAVNTEALVQPNPDEPQTPRLWCSEESDKDVSRKLANIYKLPSYN